MRGRRLFGTVFIGKNSLIKEGIVRILSTENFRTLDSVGCANELSRSKLQSHRLLILLIYTEDDCEALVEQIEIVRKWFPKARIAVVAYNYPAVGEMVSAFRAGADGYLTNRMRCDVFIKSVELMMMGEVVFPPQFMSLVVGHQRDYLDVEPSQKGDSALVLEEETVAQHLSPRENAILQCLVEGHSNKSIARKINIAEATVKVHVKAILRKIRVQNRTQAAIWGVNNGSRTRQLISSSVTSEDFSFSTQMDSDDRQIDLPGPSEEIEKNPIKGPSVSRVIRN